MEALQAVHEGDLRGRPGTSKERQYALILVAGGDKAYNCWDTLEDTVEDPKKVDQVWDTFEKELQTINFILAFQRCLLSRFQARPHRVNSRPGSPHQADCQGMPMEEGV